MNNHSIILLDLETTGFSALKNEAVEIGALRLELHDDGFSISAEMQCLIKLSPGRRLPAEITELTGITGEMLERDGIPRSDAASRFAGFCGSSQRPLLIAHNADFDIPFLRALLRQFCYQQLVDDADILDTLTVFRDRKSYPHKLSDAVSHYKLSGKVANSHRAMGDAKATFAVLNAMHSERQDLDCYINLIGYNPKYGRKAPPVNSRVRYLPQPYDSPVRLYEQLHV